MDVGEIRRTFAKRFSDSQGIGKSYTWLPYSFSRYRNEALHMSPRFIGVPRVLCLDQISDAESSLQYLPAKLSRESMSY